MQIKLFDILKSYRRFLPVVGFCRGTELVFVLIGSLVYDMDYGDQLSKFLEYYEEKRGKGKRR